MRARAFSRAARGDVEEDRLESADRGRVGDAASHEARAEDGDPIDGHGALAYRSFFDIR